MDRKIVKFRQDDEKHWVAILDCGHGQHTRHQPPWINRPWVLSHEGRQGMLGRSLSCVKCDQQAPADTILGKFD